MKRKHRVMVELTYDSPVTAKNAARFIRRLLDGDSIEQVIAEEGNRTGAEATHFTVKQGDRVLTAEAVKNRRKDE